MQTFLQLKQKLRGVLWPSGEQERLRTPHDGFFKEAMMELQKWVECCRQNNVSQFAFEDTYWHDAKTVVNAPFGEIRKVYTVANEEFRDQVTYRSATWEEMECWAKRLWAATTPTNTAGDDLTLGYHLADETGDSSVGRARIGIWCIHRKRLYLAPWIQSSETVIVDWDGEKNDWADTDMIDDTYWTIDVEAAISYYVGYKHEIFYGDPNMAGKYDALFRDKLADIIWKCREYTRKKPDVACDAGTEGQLTGITQEDIDDDEPTDTVDEDTVLFDAVGDLGDVNADTAAVAAAIISDNPELFIPLGDLTYNDDFETDFGTNYESFLEVGSILPVPGNHDEIDGNLDAYKEYFADYIANNGEYYDFTKGGCHFFVLNTEDSEGLDADSVQAEWLRAKMLLSVATWKIVVMHRAPFSSDDTHGSDTDLQLAFKEWGCSVVIAAHAHDYERLEVDGLPYFVVGTGGHSMRGFGTVEEGSVLRYNTKFGRLQGEANCDEMTLTFKTVDGDIIDTLTLKKE